MTVLRTFRNRPDEQGERVRAFDAARAGATRADICHDAETAYEVAARYLDEFEGERLLVSDAVPYRPGPRQDPGYEPTAFGRHVGAHVDRYRETLEHAGVDDPDAYLSRLGNLATPERVEALWDVAAAPRSGSELADRYGTDPDTVRNRMEGLADFDLVSVEDRTGVVYDHAREAGRITHGLIGFHPVRAADAFDALRWGETAHLLRNVEDYDNPNQAVDDVDATKRTVYSWHDRLVDSGLLTDDMEITERGDRLRLAFGDLDLGMIARELQSEDRIETYLAATDATKREIADRTGVDINNVRQIVDGFEDVGLVERRTDPGNLYHPGPLATPTIGLVAAVGNGLQAFEPYDRPISRQVPTADPRAVGRPDPERMSALMAVPDLAGSPGKREVLAHVAETGRIDRDDLYGWMDRDNRVIGRSIRFLADDGYLLVDGDEISVTDRGVHAYEDPGSMENGPAPIRYDAARRELLGEMLAGFRQGATVRDIARERDESYQTVKSRFHEFERAGWLTKKGTRRNPHYVVHESALADDGLLELAEAAALPHMIDDAVDRGTAIDRWTAPFRDVYRERGTAFRDRWEADELPEDLILPQWKEMLAVAQSTVYLDGTLGDATTWADCGASALENHLERLPDEAVAIRNGDPDIAKPDRPVRVHPRFRSVFGAVADRLPFHPDDVSYQGEDPVEPAPDADWEHVTGDDPVEQPFRDYSAMD